ncbi:MAG: transposase, partial [Mycobacteriaceae bacterium]
MGASGTGVQCAGQAGTQARTGLRRVVDAMLYVSHTGCQWRFSPEAFGPWTRVWSQFRGWSRNGTWGASVDVLHVAAHEADGRADATPSMVVIDTRLARGAPNGGFTFHDRGGPYGHTKGATSVVAVDVTGLPVGALVVPASTHENRATELMLEHLSRQGVTWRLELVLVDRGVTAAAARTLGRHHDLELRRVGWDDKQPVFRPIRHAWRVEVAHGRLPLADTHTVRLPTSAYQAGKVETNGVDIGVAPVVHHDVVPRLPRDLGKVGMQDQRPVGLTAQQLSLRRVHDQQPPVGEEVDAHRERRHGHNYLVAAIGAQCDHLLSAQSENHRRPSCQRGDSPNTTPSIRTSGALTSYLHSLAATQTRPGYRTHRGSQANDRSCTPASTVVVVASFGGSRRAGGHKVLARC